MVVLFLTSDDHAFNSEFKACPPPLQVMKGMFVLLIKAVFITYKKTKRWWKL